MPELRGPLLLVLWVLAGVVVFWAVGWLLLYLKVGDPLRTILLICLAIAMVLYALARLGIW